MKKKGLFIIIGIIFIISLYLVAKHTNKKGKGEPKLIINQVESVYPKNNSIDTSLTINELKIPNALPILVQEGVQTYNYDWAQQVARNLGFVEDPESYQDLSSGQNYIWRDNEHTLIIAPQVALINYDPSYRTFPKLSSVVNKQIKESEYKRLAINFISRLLGISEETIKAFNIEYLDLLPGNEFLSTVDKETGRIIQVNLTLAESEYPVLTLGSTLSQVYVQLLKDGSIHKVEILYTQTLKPTSEQYKLLTSEQLLQNLDKATIVSINNGNYDPYDSNNSIEKIKIQNVDIAYLLNAKDTGRADPVFVLEGNATVKSLNDEVKAILYLPAISSNQD